MDQNPVDWYEGMFLRPQHFQTQERFRQRQLRLNIESFMPFSWGFSRLEIETNSLSNGLLVIRQALARFPSGTIIDTPTNCILPPLQVRPLIGESGEVDIQLALPVVMTQNQISPSSRYESREILVPDDHDGTLQPIQVRQFLPLLLPAEKVTQGYETLPIARLRRSSQSAEAVELVSTHIPPLLSSDASPVLQYRIIQSLSDTILRKLNSILPGYNSQTSTGAQRFFSDSVMLTRLSLMNQAYAILSVISGSMKVHPFSVYRDLCDIIGRLAILGITRNRKVGSLPNYDHNNLGEMFFMLKRRVEELVEVLEEPGFKERPFVGMASRMQVSLDSQWLEPGWSLLIGIRTNLEMSDASRLFASNGPMDFKISSAERVDQIFRMGQRGLHFEPVTKVPDALNKITRSLFLSLGRDEAANEWTSVRRSMNLAVRFNEGLLTGSIHDQTKLQLRFDGKPVEMEMVLYAISPAEHNGSTPIQSQIRDSIDGDYGSGSA